MFSQPFVSCILIFTEPSIAGKHFLNQKSENEGPSNYCELLPQRDSLFNTVMQSWCTLKMCAASVLLITICLNEGNNQHCIYL